MQMSFITDYRCNLSVCAADRLLERDPPDKGKLSVSGLMNRCQIGNVLKYFGFELAGTVHILDAYKSV